MKSSFSHLSLLLVATLVVLSEGYQGCPDIDPMDHTVHLPHETDCTLFYRCDHGYPKLDRCPASLHFNPKLQVCDWPNQAGCTAGEAISSPSPPNPEMTTSAPITTTPAPRTTNTTTGTSTPAPRTTNTTTRTSTPDPSTSTTAPSTSTPVKEIANMGSSFIERINTTLHGRQANMLFLLDESGSLSPSQFAMEVLFMKAIVSAFPLGYMRAAGAITFSTFSMVDIRISTNDTCSFMDQADLITYSGGGTNILTALQLAISEVVNNGVHNFTLVFLITDGVSYTDPQPAADYMKNNEFALFTVGIGSFNPSQLRALASMDDQGVPIFFPIENFAVFQKVADYLNTAYNSGGLSCASSYPSPTNIPY